MEKLNIKKIVRIVAVVALPWIAFFGITSLANALLRLLFNTMNMGFLSKGVLGNSYAIVSLVCLFYGLREHSFKIAVLPITALAAIAKWQWGKIIEELEAA